MKLSNKLKRRSKYFDDFYIRRLAKYNILMQYLVLLSKYVCPIQSLTHQRQTKLLDLKDLTF